MKKILIGSDLNYAASKGSTAANTALTPNLLRTGAIAVYGLNEEDADTSANNNKEVLITDNVAPGVGNTDIDIFAGDHLSIHLGDGDSNSIVSLQRSGVIRLHKEIHREPVVAVAYIGFNGTGGSLATPTIVTNSDATVKIAEEESTTADKIRESKVYTTAPLVAGQSPLSIANLLVNAVNNDSTSSQVAFLSGNGSFGATSTATGALQLTKGSTTITFATALPAAGGWGTVTLGQVIAINNNINGVTGVTAANAVNGTLYTIVGINGLNLTLDKPYMGSTVSLTQAQVQAGAVSLVTGTTEVGIKLIAKIAGKVYSYAKEGVIENATITVAQFPSFGLGTAAAIAKIEAELLPYRGQFDSVYMEMQKSKKLTDPNATYITYALTYRNSTTASGFEHNKSELSTVMIAVPTGYVGLATLDAILGKIFAGAQSNI
jgi:hypothetical protein